VSAYARDVKAVLAQLRVDAKTNEHKAALELLGVLRFKGKVITGDAMFTHRGVCSAVIRGEAIASCLSRRTGRRSPGTSRPPSPSPRLAIPPLQAARREAEIERADEGHGRIEKRSIEVTTSLAEYLGPGWPGCSQVFRLRRERRTGAKVEVEVVLGITSLRRERAGAKELLALTRGHWGIENGLHGVRDGTLREDASRIRRGSAAEVMAFVRNIAIFVFRREGYTRAATATRDYVCHPREALEILSTSIRE
jgi:predicted transposase YbfD/YdcC